LLSKAEASPCLRLANNNEKQGKQRLGKDIFYLVWSFRQAKKGREGWPAEETSTFPVG